jgi:hypothetical protein
MWRSLSSLIVGVFSTALLSSAVSVYLLHDVDRDQIGRWNEAFAALCAESFIFAVMVGGIVGLLTLLARQLFHLKGYSPRAVLSLVLGIAVTALQYPWDFLGRKFFPKIADSSLDVYLVIAIIACTVILLRDNYQQMRLHKTLEATSQSV